MKPLMKFLFCPYLVSDKINYYNILIIFNTHNLYYVTCKIKIVSCEYCSIKLAINTYW